MWLLPWFPSLARAAGRVYYRLTLAGESVPATGPLLLVANHPNSLLDPMLVVAAARRPVRFLAKAPLFDDPKVGWLMRAVGAIPVYRRADDPSLMDKNVDAFRAVHAALAQGDAVGIFPEGVSHSAPALAPLKTGAARIALGAAKLTDQVFPVMPIGLVHRDKDAFRSEAQVLIGRPVAWEDLRGRGPQDQDAVRTLTERIAAGLRTVTVNLDTWADRPLVECAAEIWDAEWGADPAAPARIGRLETITDTLRAIRFDPASRWGGLVHEVADYARRLRRLRLTPRDLDADVRLSAGLRWSIRRAHLLTLPALLTALAGLLLFWIPYQATGRIATLFRPDPDQRASYKLMIGIPVYTLWVAALAVAVAVTVHPLLGAGTLVLTPAIGMVGLVLRERWRGAWSDARRFFLLRSRQPLVRALRERRRYLATRLRALYEETVLDRSTA